MGMTVIRCDCGLELSGFSSIAAAYTAALRLGFRLQGDAVLTDKVWCAECAPHEPETNDKAAHSAITNGYAKPLDGQELSVDALTHAVLLALFRQADTITMQRDDYVAAAHQIMAGRKYGLIIGNQDRNGEIAVQLRPLPRSDGNPQTV